MLSSFVTISGTDDLVCFYAMQAGLSFCDIMIIWLTLIKEKMVAQKCLKIE